MASPTSVLILAVVLDVLLNFYLGIKKSLIKFLLIIFLSITDILNIFK